MLLPPCGHLFFFDQPPNPQIYLIKTNLIVSAQIRQIFPDVQMSGSLTSPNKVSSFSGKKQCYLETPGLASRRSYSDLGSQGLEDSPLLERQGQV